MSIESTSMDTVGGDPGAASALATEHPLSRNSSSRWMSTANSSLPLDLDIGALTSPRTFIRGEGSTIEVTEEAACLKYSALLPKPTSTSLKPVAS